MEGPDRQFGDPRRLRFVTSAADRHSGSEPVRLPADDVPGAESAHRQACDINPLRVDAEFLLQGRQQFQNQAQGLGRLRRLLVSIGGPVHLHPPGSLGALGRDQEARILLADLGLEKFGDAMDQLPLIVRSPLSGPVQKQHQGILSLGIIVLRLEQAIGQRLAGRVPIDSLF